MREATGPEQITGRRPRVFIGDDSSDSGSDYQALIDRHGELQHVRRPGSRSASAGPTRPPRTWRSRPGYQNQIISNLFAIKENMRTTARKRSDT